MKVRPVCAADYVALREIHKQREYKFDLPLAGASTTEEAIVVESDTGELIAACFAIRTPEIVLLMGKGHPVVKLEAIRRIHEVMRQMARRSGYVRGFAVVSPDLKGYVRHMVKKFRWVEDYPIYRIE